MGTRKTWCPTFHCEQRSYLSQNNLSRHLILRSCLSCCRNHWSRSLALSPSLTLQTFRYNTPRTKYCLELLLLLCLLEVQQQQQQQHRFHIRSTPPISILPSGISLRSSKREATCRHTLLSHKNVQTSSCHSLPHLYIQ